MVHRRKNAVDDRGDTIETDAFPKTDADRLLRFNITGQRIADLCNRERVFFPWDSEVHRGTWNRALNGHPVWHEIVDELDGLYQDQKRNPRKYLPGPPADDLFSWMKRVAGATWWVQVLSLDMKANTLTAWMTRGASDDAIQDLRERVERWWGKVDAACGQADMVRAYHAMERVEHERMERDEWDAVIKRPDSFESYFYTYVHEDGHSVDEARLHYVEMADIAKNHHLNLLDLHDPGAVAERVSFQDPINTKDKFGARFDKLWALGLDGAMPREMPDGTELSDTMREGRWKDRRFEEGPWDANVGLYKKWYRERTSWKWCKEKRRKVPFASEVIAVSDDGETWVEPTERQRRGWDNQGLEIARYREEHGESPDNQFTREVEEAKDVMLTARAMAREKVEMDAPEWAEYERARIEYERALDNF